jgi:hypothetical protein
MRLTRLTISLIAFCALFLGAAQAQAKSCSSFAVIQAYNADKSQVKVKWTNGKVNKFFPKPEGAPTDTTKIPGKCKSKVTKKKIFPVKSTGGRLSVTQIRTNFEGKMLNDTDDKNWLPAKLKELIDGKTEVVLIIRPGMGKDAPLNITTVYLPANEDDFKEIKRLEEQAEDI